MKNLLKRLLAALLGVGTTGDFDGSDSMPTDERVWGKKGSLLKLKPGEHLESPGEDFSDLDLVPPLKRPARKLLDSLPQVKPPGVHQVPKVEPAAKFTGEIDWTDKDFAAMDRAREKSLALRNKLARERNAAEEVKPVPAGDREATEPQKFQPLSELPIFERKALTSPGTADGHKLLANDDVIWRFVFGNMGYTEDEFDAVGDCCTATIDAEPNLSSSLQLTHIYFIGVLDGVRTQIAQDAIDAERVKKGSVQ